MHTLSFKHALTPEGIVDDCLIEVDEAGRITAMGHGSPPHDGTLALPGMPNAHSHAFQRALSGQGEQRSGEDSFWSWRKAMYGLAAKVDPGHLHAIACQAYAEMLAAGFTSVAEFHYLHRAPGGDAIAMSGAVIQAARDTGIRLRLLPVYYHAAGFGVQATAAQSRFVHASVDDYLELLEALDHPHLGIAPHSLRAVPLDHLRALAASGRHPVHIHIAEQQAEVEQCLAAQGARPVELLADTVELDTHWTLVHATHADEAERRRIIDAGATVALCPLTEAYLGDGLFAAVEFQANGGRMAIGSDSNARIDAIEELRWLEYGQRLRDGRRARLADETGVGAPLWAHAARAGAQACGFDCGALEVGAYADVIALNPDAAPFTGLDPRDWLDAWLTGGSRHDIEATWVGGRRIEPDDRHRVAFERTMRAVNA